MSDVNIMNMRLTQAGVCDTHKLAVLLQFLDRFAAGISHTRAKAAHQLMDIFRERTTEGHTAFDPFGDELDIFCPCLEIAVFAALFMAPMLPMPR